MYTAVCYAKRCTKICYTSLIEYFIFQILNNMIYKPKLWYIIYARAAFVFNLDVGLVAANNGISQV